MEQPASYGREYMNEEEEEDEEEEDEEDEESIPTGARVAPVPSDEEEEEEYFLIEVEDEDGNDISYYTQNEENGDLYAVLSDEDIGAKVGKIVNGELELF
jgi:hypothetical protein